MLTSRYYTVVCTKARKILWCKEIESFHEIAKFRLALDDYKSSYRAECRITINRSFVSLNDVELETVDCDKPEKIKNILCAISEGI